jgi:hypothetical protein
MLAFIFLQVCDPKLAWHWPFEKIVQGNIVPILQTFTSFSGSQTPQPLLPPQVCIPPAKKQKQNIQDFPYLWQHCQTHLHKLKDFVIIVSALLFILAML